MLVFMSSINWHSCSCSKKNTFIWNCWLTGIEPLLIWKIFTIMTKEKLRVWTHYSFPLIHTFPSMIINILSSSGRPNRRMEGEGGREEGENYISPYVLRRQSFFFFKGKEIGKFLISEQCFQICLVLPCMMEVDQSISDGSKTGNA